MKTSYTLCFFLVLASYSNIFSQLRVGAPGTGPGGSDPQFNTLREACAYLDSLTPPDFPISEITIEVTSDLTEPAGVVLSAAGFPSIGTVSIRFTPMAGVDPVITFTDPDDTSIYFGWSIRSFATLVEGITIQTDSSSTHNIIPLSLSGGNSLGAGVSIAQCNILYKSKVTSTDSTDYYCAILASSNFYIHDNFISSDFPGVSPYSAGILSLGGDRNHAFRNKIEAKHIGIVWGGGFRGNDVFGNEIVINQDKLKIPSVGIHIIEGFPVRVSENNIILSKNNFSTNSDAIGINVPGTAAVYNNMISGFYLCTIYSKPTSVLTGIQMSNIDRQFSYNTIKMNDVLVDSGMNNPIYIGIKTSFLISTAIKNNIVVNEENDIPSYCIYLDTVLFGNSDYNDFSIPGAAAFTGLFHGTPAKTLEDWQMISGLDSHSVAVEVSFVSDTDLHLTGASNGDTRLTGVPVSGITTDIDFEIRDAQHPYMGADEASVPLASSVLAVNDNTKLPGKYELLQNYPNPFNPVTKIVYNLPHDSHVKIEIISMNGELIKVLMNENKSAGRYENYFSAENLASGIYIYRLTAGNQVISKKMLLLK